jgi:hypothetical protein
LFGVLKLLLLLLPFITLKLLINLLLILLHPHQAFFESIVIVARLGSLSPKMLPLLLLLLLQNVDDGTQTDKEDKEEDKEEARAERQ